MHSDPFSCIKNNLLYAGNGYYISPTDPFIFKKLSHLSSLDGETLYKAGLCTETQAKRCLLEFKSTGKRYLLRAYRRHMNESLALMKKSWHKGYTLAAGDLLRIYNDINKSEYISHSGAINKITGYIIMLLLSFSLGMLLPVLFYLFC